MPISQDVVVDVADRGSLTKVKGLNLGGQRNTQVASKWNFIWKTHPEHIHTFLCILMLHPCISSGIRTHDLSLLNLVLYRCATTADLSLVLTFATLMKFEPGLSLPTRQKICSPFDSFSHKRCQLFNIKHSLG